MNQGKDLKLTLIFVVVVVLLVVLASRAIRVDIDAVLITNSKFILLSFYPTSLPCKKCDEGSHGNSMSRQFLVTTRLGAGLV